MRKTNGLSLSLLVVATCCSIFVCLGYVELFRGLTHKVNDPQTAEFWQLRHLALKWRNPENEAREAFVKGSYGVFDAGRLVEPSDHQVAKYLSEKQTAPAFIQASIGFGNFFDKRDPLRQLTVYHQRFTETSHEFARTYNHEMTRLLNSPGNRQ